MKFSLLKITSPFRAAHRLHLAVGILAAMGALMAPTTVLAEQKVVSFLRHECATGDRYRDIHIFSAGRVYSGNPATPGCDRGDPRGACMSEPFAGSKPFQVRNSNYEAEKDNTFKVLCHTLDDRTKSARPMHRIVGAGIEIPGVRPTLGFMEAIPTWTKFPAIDFVYSSGPDEANQLASQGWSRQASPGYLFAKVADAEAYLASLASLVPPPPPPPRLLTPPQKPTAKDPPGAIKGWLEGDGCKEAGAAGNYVCSSLTGFEYCRTVGKQSKVATSCEANIVDQIAVDIPGCTHIMGRAKSLLCATQEAMDACKHSVDAQKALTCNKTNNTSTYKYRKSKEGIVGCENYLGNLNNSDHTCYSPWSFAECKTAVDQNRVSKCVLMNTNEGYAGQMYEHKKTDAEKVADLAALGCEYHAKQTKTPAKTASCSTEAAYKSCEKKIDKVFLLGCSLHVKG